MTETERAPSMTRAAAGAATIGSGPPALIVGVQTVRRSGGPFFLLDVAFLSDARFRALARRLPDSDDFNSAVGAWTVALAAARRNGRPEIDAGTETGSRFLPELLAVGLLIEEGFRPESFKAWAPMSPQQAAAGRARSLSGTRDDAGRFTSALAALDPTVQPSLPLPSLPITSTEEGVQGEEPADELSIFVYIAEHGAFLRPDSGLGVRLMGLIDRRGIGVVMETAEAMVSAGAHLSDRQWVFGLERALEAIPSVPVGEILPDTTVADERSRRIYDRMMKGRLEYLQQTGTWPDEWGERPVVTA